MPFRLTLEARLPPRARLPESYGPAHRLACVLMEDGSADDHDSQEKNFAVLPPLMSNDGSFVEMAVHILSDDLRLVDRFRQRVIDLPFGELNLGPKIPLVDPVVEVSGLNWKQLTEVQPLTVIRIETLSPVLFRRNGLDIPLPDPYLTITQLVRRWNNHVDVEELVIPDEWATRLARSVSVMSLNIHSKVQSVKGHKSHPVTKTGFVGEVSFTTSLRHPDEHRLFAMLFEFAEYCGIGALTTFGFGAIQII